METFPTLSLATAKARELHQKTGLSYHVVCYDDDDWFIVRDLDYNMTVWRSFITRSQKK